MMPLTTRKPKGTRINTVEITEVILPTQPAEHPLEKVFGIFKDEPLMDALMERVREDRHAECEAGTAE